MIGEPVVPVVHRNGSGREALLEERATVRRHLRESMAALDAMAPNARDYYPVAGLFERAVEQHRARVGALRAVYESLEAEMERLLDDDRVWTPRTRDENRQNA